MRRLSHSAKAAGRWVTSSQMILDNRICVTPDRALQNGTCCSRTYSPSADLDASDNRLHVRSGSPIFVLTGDVACICSYVWILGKLIVALDKAISLLIRNRWHPFSRPWPEMLIKM
ncbi:hypothetical protein PSPO01_10247 [Paraphaeosphaeria sporulosa]